MDNHETPRGRHWLGLRRMVSGTLKLVDAGLGQVQQVTHRIQQTLRRDPKFPAPAQPPPREPPREPLLLLQALAHLLDRFGSASEAPQEPPDQVLARLLESCFNDTELRLFVKTGFGDGAESELCRPHRARPEIVAELVAYVGRHGTRRELFVHMRRARPNRSPEILAVEALFPDP